ncbi:ankyrin repeat domain-containing protein [candidate division KSB1 bacterium]|nr:ankyrin repeat domain-containing protein [candidate division KSB1 bacterium]
MDRNANLELALFQAIIEQDIPAVEQLVDEGVNVNAHGDDGISVLCKAVYYLPADTVEFLIESGADVNEVSKNRLVPLKTAVVRGDPRIVELLLENGANVNACDDSGISPLMQAAVDGKFDIARLLLENNADPDIKTQSGKTAAMLAAEFEHPEIVELLEEDREPYEDEEEIQQEENSNSDEWKRTFKSKKQKPKGYKIPLIIALSATALIILSLFIYNGKKKAYAFENQKKTFEIYLSSYKYAEQKSQTTPSAQNEEQVRVYRDRIEKFVDQSDPRIKALWENYKRMHAIDSIPPTASTRQEAGTPAIPPTEPQVRPPVRQQTVQQQPAQQQPAVQAKPAAPIKKHEHEWYDVIQVESWDVLNIRIRADYRSTKVGTIPYNGKCVKNMHQTQTVGKYLWMKIQYNGVTGWVNSHFLTPAQNCP